MKVLRVGVAVAMLELGIFVAGYLAYWIIDRPGDLDFGSQYAAAYIGVHYGWGHLYDTSLIGPIEAANHLDGYAPFQHPPPDAWLAVPFLLLPLRWAALIWQALLLGALVASALIISPARRWNRVFALLSVAGFQPCLVALGYGTMSPVVLILLCGALIALESDAPLLAGVLLGMTALKPQLTLLVIPVLLAAGYWKTAVIAIAVMAALALASAAVMGAAGTRDYVTFLLSPGAINHQMPLTIKSLVGVGPSIVAWTGIVLVAAAAVSFRFRLRPDTALVLGILSSLFVAEHLNVGDLVLWLLPIWLAFRTERPFWLKATAGATWIAGWFAIGLPAVCVAMEAVLAVGFVVAAARARPVPPRAPAASAIRLPASAPER